MNPCSEVAPFKPAKKMRPPAYETIPVETGFEKGASHTIGLAITIFREVVRSIDYKIAHLEKEQAEGCTDNLFGIQEMADAAWLREFVIAWESGSYDALYPGEASFVAAVRGVLEHK